jgi:hypothetical protein
MHDPRPAVTKRRYAAYDRNVSPEPRIPLLSPDVKRIAREYAPQFDAAEALLHTIWESAPRQAKTRFQIALMEVLGRSIGTYRALIQLLHGGFTDQAWMLNRVLFEDVVFAYWIALPRNRESAQEKISTHIEADSQRRDYVRRRLEEEGADALRDLEWAGRTELLRDMAKRIREIEDLYGSVVGDTDELYMLHEGIYRHANRFLHVSGASLDDTLRRGSIRVGRGRLFGYGQDSTVNEEQMLWGFRLSAIHLDRLARLLFVEADRPLDDLEAALEAVILAVNEYAPSRQQLGRNEPCWCGSGQKFKRCHGSDVGATDPVQ